MNYWILILILIIIVALVLLYFNKDLLFSLDFSKISGGKDSTESLDPQTSKIICEKTNKYVYKFLDSKLDEEKLGKINALHDDIKQDTNLTAKKIKSLKSEKLNVIISKIILEIILDCYIYDKQANKISRSVIEDNIKKLNLVKKSANCFENIEQIVAHAEKIIANNNNFEEKNVQISQNECFRKLKILELTKNSCKIQELQDELTKKNIQLREKSKSDPICEIKLHDCESENSILRTKIYDLKRDIENLRLAAVRNPLNFVNSTDLNDLRTRLDDCLRQKTQLLNDLQAARTSHDQRESEIRQLEQQLRDCHEIVNALSNA